MQSGREDNDGKQTQQLRQVIGSPLSTRKHLVVRTEVWFSGSAVRKSFPLTKLSYHVRGNSSILPLPFPFCVWLGHIRLRQLDKPCLSQRESREILRFSSRFLFSDGRTKESGCCRSLLIGYDQAGSFSLVSFTASFTLRGAQRAKVAVRSRMESASSSVRAAASTRQAQLPSAVPGVLMRASLPRHR